jgi:hypothetical protein
MLGIEVELVPAGQPCFVDRLHQSLHVWVQAALELVRDFMEHSTPCLQEGIQLLMRLHFAYGQYPDWNTLPGSCRR